MKRIRALVVGGLMVLGLGLPGYTEMILDRASVMLSARVPEVVSVDIEPKEVVFTSDDILEAQIIDGKIVVMKLDVVAITVSGNTGCVVWISAADDSFTSINGTIPSSRMEWRYEGGAWTPLDTNMKVLYTQPILGKQRIGLDLRLNLDILDPFGDYGGQITITIAAI